jgi:hypothetical protein
MGNGAVSRYKLSRSKEFILVQNFNWVQMSVSGCNINYEFVSGAAARAKTVTSFLIILSVLLVSAVKVASTNLSFYHKSFFFSIS